LKVHLRLAPWFLLSTLLATPLPAAEDPLLQTFVEAKAAYRAKRWADAEVALRHLLELAAAPEREPDLPRILPAYHFYAAAVAWELKDEERARKELARYFEFQPEATIDPGLYPKSFCIFFDAQRTTAARVAPPAPPAAAGLPNFSTMAADANTVPSYSGSTEWPDTPVRHLLTGAEKTEFKGLPDDAARREWVFRFWKRFDPDPASPDNEFEIEFYRRVQYADQHFSTETVRGSLSDRGHVLLILGPPSYVGRRPLLRSDDIMTRLNPTSRMFVTTGEEGEVETWYYRSDRLPKGLPFRNLEYRFYTKQGYGTGVFQKDARELLALQKATRLLRPGS
jgi:GWxTD domain-containing protein